MVSIHPVTAFAPGDHGAVGAHVHAQRGGGCAEGGDVHRLQVLELPTGSPVLENPWEVPLEIQLMILFQIENWIG